MNKKAVVTGGAGFIGSHIVDALVAADFQVHVVDNLSGGYREQVNPAATFHEVDIRDAARVNELFGDLKESGDIDAVFHLAALPQVQYSIDRPDDTYSVNVIGMLNVLMAAARVGAKKVVYSSSTAVYGDQETSPIHEGLSPHPKSPYALQKYEGELMCRLWSELYGLPTVCLRYFNVYGPRQRATGAYPSAITKFIELKREGKPLTIVGTGTQTRDYVHVKDIVRANMNALASEKVGKGEVINIGTGAAVSVLDVAQIIGGPVVHIDPRVEIEHSLADNTRAAELIDWKPTIAFKDGLAELLESALV